MDLSAARATLATALADTGLLVAVEPSKTRAPGLLVGPITEVENAGGCAWSVTVPVYLVNQAPATGKSVDYLARNLGLVLEALQTVAQVTEAALGTVDVGQGDLPAYEIPAVLVLKE